MNMTFFTHKPLKCRARVRAERGKKGAKKMAVINSWSWGCSQVNLCGSIWPWFGANEQMERVTKTQDSSLPGETHNTFLLSPVIKRYPAIHPHTHTHKETHTLHYSRVEREAIEKGTITETAKHRLEALLRLQMKNSTWAWPAGSPYLQRLIQLLHWPKICACERATTLVFVCVLYNDSWPIDAFYHDEDLLPGPVGPWLSRANCIS